MEIFHSMLIMKAQLTGGGDIGDLVGKSPDFNSTSFMSGIRMDIFAFSRPAIMALLFGVGRQRELVGSIFLNLSFV